MDRVVVGLSGGVDSSVAAYLLREQGYDVIGMFMKNWHDDSVTISSECPWLEDSNDALIVAEKLGIPFQTIDLSEQYKERIVDYMFREYEHGRTPNPDVLCNREIKFDIFLDTALKLGADYVGTGHYCRKDKIEKNGNSIYRLLAGSDPNKDQSYFLCQLNQFQLGKALFPIGKLIKPEVRKIARDLDLVTAEKKDSQGLCFVGKVRLPEFLQQQLKPKQGSIIEVPEESLIYEGLSFDLKGTALKDLESASKPFEYSLNDGKIVGEHDGAYYFTIGQRKGLNVGGNKEPLFVIAVDTTDNVIYTGQGSSHPGLYRKGLFVKKDDIHWIREDMRLKSTQRMKVLARIRYRQPLQKAELHKMDKGLFVIFNKPQKGITPGQFVAWYEGEELLGSGVISH
ncbi:tRNA 2-thiouridine(34) synthase MnmA [Bacteroidota bacterium]